MKSAATVLTTPPPPPISLDNVLPPNKQHAII